MMDGPKGAMRDFSWEPSGDCKCTIILYLEYRLINTDPWFVLPPMRFIDVRVSERFHKRPVSTHDLQQVSSLNLLTTTCNQYDTLSIPRG